MRVHERALAVPAGTGLLMATTASGTTGGQNNTFSGNTASRSRSLTNAGKGFANVAKTAGR